MKSRYSRIALSGALALLLAVTTGLAQAGPKPLPPNSNAYGMGYAELAADWVEWIMSIPVDTNPLLDPDGTDAAVGQSGKVWFLVGTTGGAATRAVTVPLGTALFFPIVNNFWVNTPEFGDPEWSPQWEADVRAMLAESVDTAENLVLEIDGRPIPNVSRLRVASEVGDCMLPVDNLFGADSGPHECVADGYWALLPPLSVGHHTIHFAGGEASIPPFSLDVTYEITVQSRGRK